MFRRNDPEARLDDLAALISATTAADLHKALVLGPPAAYEREVNTPLTYFRNAHDKDPARSVETAMLLGTDLRWSVAAGPLIEAIEATGIVPPDELDLLARAFISADAKVYWRCPDGWFSTVGIAVSDIEFPPAAPDADPDDSEETGPTVASRVVAPGLRRWAAARAVRLDPSAWPAVLARSHEVGAAGGGGLMHGLLDSIEVLPLKARSLVRQEALNSGRSDVRQAALQQIALIDWSLARTSGMRDANERVRRWAAGIVDPSAAVSPATELTLDSGAPRLTSKQSAVAQASLFD